MYSANDHTRTPNAVSLSAVRCDVWYCTRLELIKANATGSHTRGTVHLHDAFTGQTTQ
jgi:hypothetical protein